MKSSKDTKAGKYMVTTSILCDVACYITEVSTDIAGFYDSVLGICLAEVIEPIGEASNRNISETVYGQTLSISIVG